MTSRNMASTRRPSSLHTRALERVVHSTASTPAPSSVRAPRLPGMDGTVRDEHLAGMARRQGAVVTRAQLYELGYTRGEVRNHVRARRWRPLGSHCVVLHTGPL